jgi:hypothetical protein
MTAVPKKLGDLPSEELREQSLNALTVLCYFLWHQYRAGQKDRLFEVIGMSFIHGVLPPQWAREAFVEACQSTPNSWDDVFGRPVPKGKSPKAARREVVSGPRVITAVERARKQGTKFPEAFDKAAKNPELSEYGLSGAKVREIYYGRMRQIRKNSPAVLGARCWEDALAIALILQLEDLKQTFQKAGLDFEKEMFGSQVTEIT